jgi:hypothetical protein
MPAILRRIAAPDHAAAAQAAEAGPLDRHYWIDAGIEPALAELLADPIMHAVMRADGVRLQEVLSTVSLASRRQQRLAAVALR